MYVSYKGNDYPIEGCTFEEVLSLLRDESDLYDSVSAIVESVPEEPVGYGIPYWTLRPIVLDIIKSRNTENKAVVYENNIEVARYPESDLLSSLFCNQLECEQGTIYEVAYALRCISKFMELGEWHFALIDVDGQIFTNPSSWPLPNKTSNGIVWGKGLKPIMWFGLKDERPIQCWSFDSSPYHTDCQNVLLNSNSKLSEMIENWKLFWFNHFWSLDWNTLWENDDVSITWAFFECGMDEPLKEFERVKSSCPIQFNEDDSFNAILSRINLFCYHIKMDNHYGTA